jgi:glycosyltransferase involved in cell wall biosynthesis
VSAWIERLGRDDIRHIFVSGADWNLGKLRNLTIEQACGEIICQWDEDDLSHPERLERQTQALIEQRAASCYLGSHFHYFQERGEVYYLDWPTAPRPVLAPVLTGTLMCWRSMPVRYPEIGPDAHRSEDMRFFRQISACGPMATLTDPPLYVYIFHGQNLFPFDHHWGLAQRKGKDSEYLRSRREFFETHLNQFDWDAHEIRVCGPDGPAFVFTPSKRSMGI